MKPLVHVQIHRRLQESKGNLDSFLDFADKILSVQQIVAQRELAQEVILNKLLTFLINQGIRQD